MTQIIDFPSPQKWLIVILLLGLSGCSMTPSQPDYPQAIAEETATVAPWENMESAQSVATLNDLISAPALEDLINIAFQSNPGLQQTLLTLQIREKQLTQAEALQLPFVGAGASAGVSEGNDRSFSSSLSINWQVDLWGQLDDIEQSAQRDMLSQALFVQSAKDTLAAEVIRNWLTIVAQSRAIDIENQRLQSLQQTETFILQRYRQGLGVLEDLDTARTAVSSSQARLEVLNENLRQQQRFLRTLVGQTQPLNLIFPEDYPAVPLPLADLPAQTLDRRPDLRAAYVAIEAASLRTDAAYKDLLPSLNLQAILQDVASSPRAALLGSPVWSLLGQFTAPLYEGGQRKAAAEIAELQTAIAYQDYRDLLLNAVTEIEQALSQEKALAKQQLFIESAVATAENNLLQYQSSYQAGLRSILDLLIIQQQNYDLQAQLDQLIFQRLLNRVNLGLALGLEVTS